MPRPATAVAADPAVDHAILAFTDAMATRKDFPTVPARTVGPWVLGAARAVGEYPIELTYTDMLQGFTRHGVTVTPLPAHRHTIMAALDALENAGYLTRTVCRVRRGGYPSYYYSLQVPTP